MIRQIKLERRNRDPVSADSSDIRSFSKTTLTIAETEPEIRVSATILPLVNNQRKIGLA